MAIVFCDYVPLQYVCMAVFVCVCVLCACVCWRLQQIGSSNIALSEAAAH